MSVFLSTPLRSHNTLTNTFTDRTASSDGVGSAGGQGECGFVSTALAEAKCTAMATTAVATDATSTVELKCSGHGECKSGGGCTCFGEWYVCISPLPPVYHLYTSHLPPI